MSTRLSYLIRWLPGLAAVVLMPAAAQEVPRHGELSEELANWKRQIEESGGGTVVVVRVEHNLERNQVRLPTDVEFREVLVRYFRAPAFLGALAETYALNLNYRGPEGLIHFVLLNMGRAEEWAHYREAILAHEFGHVWLSVRGYPAPLYDGGEHSCAALVAGDAVQHIVIRKELRRRRIPHLAYWISKLETTQRTLDAGFDAPLTECRRLMLLGEWLDVQLGLSPGQWRGYDRFLAAMELNFPMLAGEVDVLYAILSGQDAEDIAVHESLLPPVLHRLYRLAARLDEGSAAGSGAPP